MRVQTFGSEFAVERLDEGVVSGLARSGEVERDTALISPEVEIAGSSISTTSGPRKLNRGSIAGEKRENVSMIVSTRSLRPVTS